MYIASCVFTRENPELSVKIQNYISEKFDIPVMRCCVPNYKLSVFTDSMPEWLQDKWSGMADYLEFKSDQTMLYVCHNCSAIFQEVNPDIPILSLWEFILNYDDSFEYPDYNNEKITVQDCWRSYDNRKEQEAVRSLLDRMNFEVVELEDNYEKTDFCGKSLYEPAPVRNLKLAPDRFVENADGKFVPHTEEKKKELMLDYCNQVETDKIVAYCHYCVKGLKLGEKNAFHLAELLFNHL